MNNTFESKYDENGKIVISDDMPPELKRAINYINERNLDINKPYEPQEIVITEDDDIASPTSVYVDDSNESETIASDPTVVQEDDLKEDEDSNIDDLENMF